MRTAGYCQLCRAYEIDQYGTVLNTADARHERACKKAGCKHPPFYELAVESAPRPNANQKSEPTE